MFQAQRSRRRQNQTAHSNLPWRSLSWDYNRNKEWNSVLWPSTLNLSTGTCINNTSVMMFRKGSFEIGGTVYPVAIKVGASFLWLSFFFTPHSEVLTVPLSFSTTPGSVRPSGTAASSAWWATCWGWWAAGPWCAASGTCRQWAERWSSS